MSKYWITTEATADYPESLMKEDFAIIPMSYTVKGEFFDGADKKLSPKQFYDACREAKTAADLPTTSMITAYQAEEFFRPILAAGNDIIHIGFSSALSGTLEQLKMAEKSLSAEFPDRRITVIDSKTACFIEGLAAYYALLKRDEGADYDECVSYIERLLPHCAGFFTIDDIAHLQRTGRVGKAEAFIGGTLHIKPVLTVDDDGKLIPFAKVISRKKALRFLVEMMRKKMLPQREQKLVAIGHADAYDDAVALEKTVKEEFGVENTVIFDVGTVIGTHVGAGMVALIFLAEDRNYR